MAIQSFSEKSNASSLPTPRSEGEILSSPNLKALAFNELKSATRNFSPDRLLGEGGFGYVFKGWIDEYTFLAAKPGSGMAVAVKKLKSTSFQGHKEWLVGLFLLFSYFLVFIFIFLGLFFRLNILLVSKVYPLSTINPKISNERF